MQLRKSTKHATIASKNAADQAAALVLEKRARRQKCSKPATESRVLTTRRRSRQFFICVDYTSDSSESDAESMELDDCDNDPSVIEVHDETINSSVDDNSDEDWAFLSEVNDTMEENKLKRAYYAHGVDILNNLTLIGNMSFASVDESKLVEDVKRSKRKKLNRLNPSKPIQTAELDSTGSFELSDDSEIDCESQLESEDEEAMEYW